jgi:hypothetical protein
VRQKNSVEIERYALSLRVRAEASVIRARWLNEVLPVVLEEFDRRLTSGESTSIVLPSIDEMVDSAIKQIEG